MASRARVQRAHETGGASNPAAGVRFERKVLAHLRDNGYWGMRSPASKGLIDLVAIKRGQALFVQCKIDGRLDPAEWNALLAAAFPVGARALLASRPARGVIRYEELTGYKVPGGKPRPSLLFYVDEVT